MNKISAILIVYNEEKLIERCLESVKDVVDEIVVIHDGECKDKTLEVCKRYTNTIFVRPHAGFMEAHFVFELNKAKNNWILRIDADEFLSKELKENIRNLVNNESVDAYEFLWPIWDGNKYVSKNWPYKLSLFKKEKISYIGILHFVPQVKGRTERKEFILKHNPDYNNLSWETFLYKWLPWARGQASTYLKDFVEIEKINYKRNDWPRQIKLRIRFNILLMPLDFFITLINTLINGAIKESFIGYKAAFFSGLYKASIDYYIFLNRFKDLIKCLNK